MAAFNAETVVEPMDWDFTKYGGGKGTIPEPSDIEVERFLKKYQLLVTQTLMAAQIKAADQLDGVIEQERAKRPKPDGEQAEDEPAKLLTLQESIEVMSRIDSDELLSSPEAAEALVGLFASICKGSPSKDQILLLPHRIRGAFYGWVMGQLTNPDFSAAVGTRPSLSLVNGG